ncbi:MAG TPA: hypothetical protein VF743_11175 [Acidimicrobiales bacterium]
MPHPGMGPTVIAAGLMVLIIGLGVINHTGDPGDPRSSPLARDVARDAGLDVPSDGEVPASQPAVPVTIGPGGTRPALRTQPTRIIDPVTGDTITVDLPVIPGVTPTTTATGGTTGATTGGTTGGTTATTTGTTTRPPTSGSTITQPTVTVAPTVPTSDTTTGPTVSEPTTESTVPTTEEPPDTDDGLLGSVVDVLGGVTSAVL